MNSFVLASVICASLLHPVLAPRQTPTPVPTIETCRFEHGGIVLAADLHLPPSSDSNPVPAVVLVHGSGSSDRNNPWTAAWAEALVARGIGVLHPDKRGCGESGGDWREANFTDLAQDAIAAVEFLRTQPRVDPARIGVIGFSQGGHVAPLVALESDHVAFAISISGSVVPILEQVRDEVELATERARLAPDLALEVLRVHDLAVDHGAGVRPFSDYADALAALRARTDVPTALVEPFPQDAADPAFAWMRRVGNPDPIEAWRDAATPALFVFGTADTQIRVAKSTQRILQELDPKSTPYDVLLLGGNGHAHFRDDAVDFVTRWIRDGAKR